MLAVLKTGAAYLPIDPAVPPARLSFMIADAAPIIAVTTRELRPRLDGFDIPVIEADSATGVVGRAAELHAPVPGDVAYAIYTSGTTGTPKGVAVTHHNVTRLFDSLDVGLASAPGQVDGRSAIPTVSTTRSGRSGEPCYTEHGWWWSPTR